MITVNLSGQHPLSHEDVSRDVYTHKLEETAIQIVSELKLEDLDNNLKELHYPTILNTLLDKYQNWFYLDEATHKNGAPRMPLAVWDLLTMVFNILENNSYDFDLAPPGVKVPGFYPPYGDDNSSMGAYIKLNESFKDIWLTNTTRIEFNSLYPNSLKYIIDKEEPEFNLPQFGKIYHMMMYARKEVKRMAHESGFEYLQKLNSFIKIWLNMAYGVLGSDKAYLRSRELVAKKINQHTTMMMRNIHNEFSGHVVYIDCDIIIFKHYHEISARFVRYLQNPKYIEIPWEEDKVDFMISRLKKFILKDSDGNLQIKGYKQKDVGEG